jgi:hypothetical protein
MKTVFFINISGKGSEKQEGEGVNKNYIISIMRSN